MFIRTLQTILQNCNMIFDSRDNVKIVIDNPLKNLTGFQNEAGDLKGSDYWPSDDINYLLVLEGVILNFRDSIVLLQSMNVCWSRTH